MTNWRSAVCSSDFECPGGRKQGGAVGRRTTSKDIHPKGHSHPAPCRSADETLSPQSGEETKKATRAALFSTARVANVPVGRRARSSGASGSRPQVPAVRGGAGDDRYLSGLRRTL